MTSEAKKIGPTVPRRYHTTRRRFSHPSAAPLGVVHSVPEARRRRCVAMTTVRRATIIAALPKEFFQASLPCPSIAAIRKPAIPTITINWRSVRRVGARVLASTPKWASARPWGRQICRNMPKVSRIVPREVNPSAMALTSVEASGAPARRQPKNQTMPGTVKANRAVMAKAEAVGAKTPVVARDANCPASESFRSNRHRIASNTRNIRTPRIMIVGFLSTSAQIAMVTSAQACGASNH